MTTLYNCKSEINADGQSRYRITKFDSDMAVESSYITDGIACECPAGERPICRHRTMLPRFIARGAVNSMWMHDFDRNGWVSMGNAEEEVEQDEAAAFDKAFPPPYTLEPMPPLPDGVVMLDLSETSPETLFNTIADAVGEPRLPPRINRRGF